VVKSELEAKECAAVTVNNSWEVEGTIKYCRRKVTHSKSLLLVIGNGCAILSG